ncbi:MAG: O-antigen ligase family protein, partial [Chloroflexota bacterium]
MGRIIAWVGIAMLSVYLVFFGGGWFGLYVAELRLASVILAGLAVLVWVIVAWRSAAWRPRSHLLPAIAVALGSMALSTATSRYPRQSIEYLGYAIVLAALYLLLVRLLAHPFFRARMGPFTVGMAIVLGIAYAVANLVHWVAWWGIVGRFTLPPLRPESESLTFGNPSTVLTIVLLFSISSFAVIGLSGRSSRIVLGLITLLAAFATFASGSRAGWLAIGITGLVMFVLLATSADRQRQARTVAVQWSATIRSRVVLGIVGLGAIGAFIKLAPTLTRRLTEGGADLRFNYLLAAERMFAEAPLVGTGPGTWVIQRVHYTFAPETDYYIPHAHNIYVQTFAELGLVGVAAGIVLVASLVLLVRDAIRDEDPTRRRWGWAAAVAMTYVAAHQILDFYANMPSILYAAAIPIAWLDATA